mmetsp:Transcript_34503/g.84552  ORF Transcript_34503/g.84552 Transcript_34503/m.84552 type:complete len:234 (-) Transcript_34503:231-932(-)
MYTGSYCTVSAHSQTHAAQRWRHHSSGGASVMRGGGMTVDVAVCTGGTGASSVSSASAMHCSSHAPHTMATTMYANTMSANTRQPMVSRYGLRAKKPAEIVLTTAASRRACRDVLVRCTRKGDLRRRFHATSSSTTGVRPSLPCATGSSTSSPRTTYRKYLRVSACTRGANGLLSSNGRKFCSTSAADVSVPKSRSRKTVKKCMYSSLRYEKARSCVSSSCATHRNVTLSLLK